MTMDALYTPVKRALPRFHLIGMIGSALLLYVLTAVPLAHAQEYGRVEKTESNVNSYFYHVQPGNATVQVQVLGDVGASGLYEVDQGTDLGQLLALSGGPFSNSRQHLTRRTVTVRLYRHQSPTRELFYEADLEHAMTDTEAYPTLQDGDVLSVEITERRRFSWRDGFTIVNTVALLALAAERFSRVW